MVVGARTVVLWMEMNTNMVPLYSMVVTGALVTMETLARVQKWDVRSWVMMDGTSLRNGTCIGKYNANFHHGNVLH